MLILFFLPKCRSRLGRRRSVANQCSWETEARYEEVGGPSCIKPNPHGHIEWRNFIELWKRKEVAVIWCTFCFFAIKGSITLLTQLNPIPPTGDTLKEKDFVDFCFQHVLGDAPVCNFETLYSVVMSPNRSLYEVRLCSHPANGEDHAKKQDWALLYTILRVSQFLEELWTCLFLVSPKFATWVTATGMSLR